MTKQYTFSEANYGWISYKIEFSTTLSLCIFFLFFFAAAILKVLWGSKVKTSVKILRTGNFIALCNCVHVYPIFIKKKKKKNADRSWRDLSNSANWNFLPFLVSEIQPPKVAKITFFATFTLLTLYDHETNTFSDANYVWTHYKIWFSTTLSQSHF